MSAKGNHCEVRATPENQAVARRKRTRPERSRKTAGARSSEILGGSDGDKYLMRTASTGIRGGHVEMPNTRRCPVACKTIIEGYEEGNARPGSERPRKTRRSVGYPPTPIRNIIRMRPPTYRAEPMLSRPGDQVEEQPATAGVIQAARTTKVAGRKG